MEIIIHPDYGTFSFSKRTAALYQKRTGKKVDTDPCNLRTDSVMISIVKELGKKENPKLEIETIRPGYESFYRVKQYFEGEERIEYNEYGRHRHKLKAALTDPTLSDSARIAAALVLLS